MNKNAVFFLTAVVAIGGFWGGSYLYKQAQPTATPTLAEADQTGLVRNYSPILGKQDAPVTIVEFFDPSCEACRAAFPFVEELRKRHGDDVRLVLRYAPFHEGSDQAVGILEAARLQDKFEPVLEALFRDQPLWAIHGAPNLDKAWELAGATGLDIERAKADAQKPEVAAVLKQEMEDIQAHNVRATPTFYVNGRQLTVMSPQVLEALVAEEVAKVKQ